MPEEMESEGKLGFGITLLILDPASSPEDYVLIEEVKDMQPLGQERSLVERTHHHSPGKMKEWIKALKDGSQIQVTCNRRYGAEGQALVRALVDDELPHPVQLIAPDEDEQCDFKALILSESTSRPIEGMQDFVFGLKVTSPLVYSVPSPESSPESSPE